MEDIKIDKVIDLSGEVCPMTFMKTKLKLKEMKEGEFLEVIISQNGITENVPASIAEEGHRIVRVKKIDDKFSLIIEKKEIVE